jgi:hypothetical protein
MPYLYLVDVNLTVLLLELLVSNLHGFDRRHCVPKVLRRERSRLHVEGLLSELGELILVKLLLLQDTEGSLLDRCLMCVD